MDRQAARHLCSLRNVERHDLDWLVDRGLAHAEGRSTGTPLCGRAVGTYFALTSTRTRTAFTMGAQRLGAYTISYGPGDLQLNTGESNEDTGRVLAASLDALVVRAVADSGELLALSGGNRMSVINAMSLDEHPTQALADLVTMYQHFGRIEGLRVLYVGEGNSTACALGLALSRYAGAELMLRTPAGDGLPAAVLEAVRAPDARGLVEERHDFECLPQRVDVVYTTRWQTTGTVKREADWRDRFRAFAVSQSLFDRFPTAVFMHDLPAHRGEEVEASVIDGNRSLVFAQAATKLYSAMAALEWCLSP